MIHIDFANHFLTQSLKLFCRTSCHGLTSPNTWIRGKVDPRNPKDKDEAGEFLVPLRRLHANLCLTIQTDARVQDISEGLTVKLSVLNFIIHISLAVSLLRMIKLFGWEKKIMKRVADKRNLELVSLWRVKVFLSVFWC